MLNCPAVDTYLAVTPKELWDAAKDKIESFLLDTYLPKTVTPKELYCDAAKNQIEKFCSDREGGELYFGGRLLAKTDDNYFFMRVERSADPRNGRICHQNRHYFPNS